MLIYYKPSGKMATSFLFTFLCYLLLIIPLLSVPIALWLGNINDGFWKGVVFLVYGFLFAIIVGGYPHFAKIRNLKFSAITSLIFGFFQLYLFFTFYLIAFDFLHIDNYSGFFNKVKESYGVIFDFKNNVHSFIKAINSQSWYVFEGNFNWLFIFFEVAFIFILTMYYALQSANEPFSEEKNDWYENKAFKPLTFINDVNDFKERLGYGGNRALKGLSLLNPESERYSEFTLYFLNKDHGYLKVVNYWKVNGDSKEKTIVKYVRVDEMFITSMISILKGENINVLDMPIFDTNSNRNLNYANQEEFELLINLQLNELRQRNTRIFWVGDEHRTNPWSLEEGGCTLVVLFENEHCRGYDKVKRPDAYAQKISRDYISNHYGSNHSDSLESYIEEIYIAQEFSPMLKKVWSSNFADSPWDVLKKYRVR